MKKRKPQPKSPPAWAIYPLTGTYAPEAANQIRQALHIWRTFETLRIQNKRSTHESMFTGLLTHENFYVRVVARLEALPLRVFREFLWRYGADFASFEACLRRFTVEHYNALDELWRQMEFQRVPDMYHTTVWNNIRRWTGNITWQKLQDQPEDFVNTDARYLASHAVVSNLFPGAPLDVGYKLYVNEHTDETELTNAEGHVLAITTEKTGWTGFITGLFDDKEFADEHGLNGTLGVDVNRDGPFGIMYRAMMGEFVFDWKVAIPKKFCWAFLATLSIHGYFWLVAPECAVLGYKYQNGGMMTLGMPFIIWLGAFTLNRFAHWSFGRYRSGRVNAFFQKHRDVIQVGINSTLHAIGRFFVTLWIGIKALMPALVVVVFSWLLYRTGISLWLIIPHMLFVASIMYRGIIDNSKMPVVESRIFVTLTGLIALQYLWMYVVPTVGEFLYDWLATDPVVVLLVASIVGLWSIGLTIGQNAGRHGEHGIARKTTLWLAALVPMILIAVVTGWIWRNSSSHVPAPVVLVIALTSCFGIAMGLMVMAKLFQYSTRNAQAEESLAYMEELIKNRLYLRRTPYLHPSVAGNAWLMSQSIDRQLVVVGSAVEAIEGLLVWYERGTNKTETARNKIVIPVLNTILPTMNENSYQRLLSIYGDLEHARCGEYNQLSRRELMDLWNRAGSLLFIVNNFVLPACNHNTLVSLIDEFRKAIETHKAVETSTQGLFRRAMNHVWRPIDWLFGKMMLPVWFVLKGVFAVFHALNRACPMYEKPKVNRFQ